MTRNFIPLAQAQNRAIWAKAQPPAGVSAAYIDKLTVAADRQQARFLAERRERLEKAIRECSEEPALFWNARYFQLCSAGTVASTTEAVTELKRLMRMELNRKSHWSFKPERVVILREALVFARFFRRFSRAVWARKAEAA